MRLMCGPASWELNMHTLISADLSGEQVQKDARLQSVDFPDPLGDDHVDDQVVVTTRRAIGRIAYVAAEAGTRFHRDLVPYDPVAWMFAPRDVFNGKAAIDACLNRDDCARGVVLHGLALGLDIDRPSLDILMNDDDDVGEDAFEESLRGGGKVEHGSGYARSGAKARLRLYTATIADTRNNLMVQVFHASVARNASEVRSRLAGRFGPDLADIADIRLGLHPSSPLVIALVPRATAEMIVRMGQNCGSPAARTFAVDIQQCIQA